MRSFSGTVSVIGAGSFGTAIATAVARSGHACALYCRTELQADAIRRTGENRRFFPGHPISPLIEATSDLDRALAASVLFLAIPAGTIDAYVARIAALPHRPIVVNLVKGLHPEHFTFARLFAAKAPDAIYVTLKGPTFAKPIFLGELSGLTCATASAAARAIVGELFSATSISLDHSDSPDAVDALSAIKNVYAVGLGIAAALDLAENTVFMMITRIAKEVRAILHALDYDREAMLSYSGLGDMLLTGLCDTSRNRTLGLMLGRGLFIDREKSGFLAEGVRAFSILRDAVARPLPILDAIVSILHHDAPPLVLLETLALRD